MNLTLLIAMAYVVKAVSSSSNTLFKNNKPPKPYLIKQNDAPLIYQLTKLKIKRMTMLFESLFEFMSKSRYPFFS